MRKRGLSEVIMAIIMIAIVLIAAVILWVVISNFFEGKSDEVLNQPVAQGLRIESAEVDSGNLILNLKRFPGPGQLDKVRVIISNGTSEQETIVPLSLGELQKKELNIPLEIVNPNLVIIYPVVTQNGKDFIGVKNDEKEIKQMGKGECEGQPIGTSCMGGTGECDGEDDCIQYNLDGGLVSHWKLDNNFKDELGNYNGTSVFQPDGKDVGFDLGVLGQAASFDGKNWIDTRKEILPFAAQLYVSDKQNNNNIYFETLSGNIDSGVSVLPNTWYHVAGVADPDNDKLIVYVNGIEKNSAAYSRTEAFTMSAWMMQTGGFNSWSRIISQWGSDGSFEAGSRFMIGRDGGGSLFVGLIDEVKIWNRALHSSEILCISNLEICDGKDNDCDGEGRM